MFLGRNWVVAIGAVVAVFCAYEPAEAQSSDEPPTHAPVQVGPLVLLPAIQVSNFGYDSNVFNRDQKDKPISDYTAIANPAVDGWIRMPRVRLTAHSQLDYYYFKQLTTLRAFDTDNRVRAEVPLNRLTPYVRGTFVNTRHRVTLEIDALARHRDDLAVAGVDVRLTPKISAGAYVRRGQVKYEANSLYLGSDLATVLNHTSRGEGVDLNWGVTPYTTFTLEVQQGRDRFLLSPQRDSKSLWVSPVLEFKPLALISGRASVGFQRRTFITGVLPKFNGTVAQVDLQSTIRERARVSLSVHRELTYSYRLGVSDYLLTDVTGSIAQRLGDSWDVGASVGRGRVNYPTQILAVPLGTPAGTDTATAAPAPVVIPDETVITYGLDVGYKIGRTRVALNVQHRARQTDQTTLNRSYDRLRVGTTVTYTF